MYLSVLYFPLDLLLRSLTLDYNNTKKKKNTVCGE